MTDAPPDKQPKKPTKPKVSAPAPDKPHHRKNPNFLSYEEAKEYIRSEMIESRSGYETWFNRAQPKALPRFPYRVYKEWVSWNDFLGVNNKFSTNQAGKWRSFAEAVKWAHTLKLRTQAEWTEYLKSGQRPPDIPARPDVVYPKWVSWNHWLGNKPSERVKVANADEIGVYYIIHEPSFPSNVLTFGVEPGGLSALRTRWNRSPYQIIRFFTALRSKMDEVAKVVEQITTPYYGYPNHRVTPNVWDVVWQIELRLSVITDLSTATVSEQTSDILPTGDDVLDIFE